MITFDQENAQDAQQIENILDLSFGANRRGKASYALRHGVPHMMRFSKVARKDGRIVGTARFWRVCVEDMVSNQTALCLFMGPVAVAPDMRGRGIGARLVRSAIAGAGPKLGGRILMVGDESYFGQFGFVSVLPRYISLPGRRDARRLLVRQTYHVPPLPMVGRLLPLDGGSRAPVLVPDAGEKRPA